MQEIKPLTSLRGIFALWVVAFHIAFTAPKHVPGFGFVWRGYIAVDVFFLLSGFVLAASYGSGTGSGSYLRFLFKRVARLFPLHLVIAIAAIMVGGYSFSANWPILTLTHEWAMWPLADADAINSPTWSISTELLANLLFPVFVWLALRGSEMRAMMAAAAFATFVAIAFSGDGSAIAARGSPIPILRCFGGFGLGICAWRFRDVSTALKSDAVILGLCVAFGAALASGVSSLIALALTVPLMVGIAGNSGRIAIVLSGRSLHWLGLRSYSIYLVHMNVLWISKWAAGLVSSGWTETVLFAVLTFAATILVSDLTYRLIEMPFQEWGRAFLLWIGRSALRRRAPA